MSNKGKPKPLNRKCKICGEKFKTNFFNVRWCSPECGTKLARILVDKEKLKRKQAQDKKAREKVKETKERLKPRSKWLNDAQTVFNQFIRLRDKDLPCISCGRYHRGQYHAGHYRSVGAAPELRFHEDNVHKQCSACNKHKSGNITEYRINLVRKIGTEKVDFLERKNHPPLKLDVDEIKDLIRIYRAKIREVAHGE